MDKQLLILRELERDQIKQIKEKAENFEVITEFNQADFDKVEIVLGWNDELEKIINNHNHSIKWIQLPSAGVDFMPMEKLKEDQVILTSSSGIHSSGIAQSVLAILLGYYRGIIHSIKAQNKKTWDTETNSEEIQYKTIMIVGTGNIGQKLAEYSKLLGMTTIGVNRSGDQVDYIDKLYTQPHIKEGLSEADIVVNILPLTDKTDHFFNESLFNVMKEGSIFINVGRGATVSTKDLVKALDSNKIQFAGLDVFEEEPLPQDSELWEREDLLITPHIAGYLENYNYSMLEIFYDNLDAHIKNKELRKNVVDYNKGY